MPTYQTDFLEWTREEAEKLRSGRLSELDASNLAEEIEDLGKSQKRAFESCLTQLMKHLLKWEHQPNLRGRGWLLSIQKQRRKLDKILTENPSLRPLLRDGEFIAEIYQSAVEDTLIETNLDDAALPPLCLYSEDFLLRG